MSPRPGDKTREQLFERRYAVAFPEATRYSAVRFEGRLHRCTVDQSKSRAGCMYRRRMRLLRLRRA